jgi:hypothetical protein
MVWGTLSYKEALSWTVTPAALSTWTGMIKNMFKKMIKITLIFQQGGSSKTQSPIQWILGVLAKGIKRPRREADHSPPTSQYNVNLYIHSPYTYSLPCVTRDVPQCCCHFRHSVTTDCSKPWNTAGTKFR